MTATKEVKELMLKLSMNSYDTGYNDAIDVIIETLTSTIEKSGDNDIKISEVISGIELSQNILKHVSDNDN